MSKTYRVGFASLVHDHVWGELNRWKAHPNVEIVAAQVMSTRNYATNSNPKLVLKPSMNLGKRC